MNVYSFPAEMFAAPKPATYRERMDMVLFHIESLGRWYPVVHGEDYGVMRPSHTRRSTYGGYALGLSRMT